MTWQRLIRGDDHRRTRFHDEKGNRVAWRQALNFPAALVGAALKKLGWQAERPMISITATRLIEGLLTPQSRVIEFGSGYSTLWLARRCGWLLSREDHAGWHALVNARLARFPHVLYQLRDPGTFAVLDEVPAASIDFALVDGTDRDGCIRELLHRMKPGGVLYLDNSDKDMTNPAGDLRRAEARLRAAAEAMGAEVNSFTDFAPSNAFAEQGLLVRFPPVRA